MTEMLIAMAIVGISIAALLRYANWRDAQFARKHCQVCTGLGAVVLTDLDRNRFLCMEHREIYIRIKRLEAAIFR